MRDGLFVKVYVPHGDTQNLSIPYVNVVANMPSVCTSTLPPQSMHIVIQCPWPKGTLCSEVLACGPSHCHQIAMQCCIARLESLKRQPFCICIEVTCTSDGLSACCMCLCRAVCVLHAFPTDCLCVACISNGLFVSCVSLPVNPGITLAYFTSHRDRLSQWVPQSLALIVLGLLIQTSW